MSIFETVFVVATYLLFLLVPGFCLVRQKRVKENVFLLSFGVSLVIFVAAKTLFGVVEGNLVTWFLCWLGTFVFTVFSSMVFQRSGWRSEKVGVRDSEPMLVWGSGLIVALFAVYHFAVGPYTEIPADFWAHLNLVTEGYSVTAGKSSELGTIAAGTEPVAFLHMLVALLWDSTPFQLVGVATFCTSVLYLAVVFWFTVWLSDKLGWRKELKLFAALTSVVFVTLTQGVSSFSYIRYYAYFPHIINFSAFFVVVVLLVEYLEDEAKSTLWLGGVAILVVTMMMINKQEAVFSLIGVSIIAMLKLLRARDYRECYRQKLGRRWLFVGAVSLAALLVGLALFLSLAQVNEDGWPHVISLRQFNERLPDWLIVNPSLRFWETVGLFGAVTYFWYALRIKTFGQLDYVSAGMLIPFVTLFNPVFVGVFLHFASWDSIWRFSYIIPIPIVAGLLTADLLRIARDRSSRWIFFTGVVLGLALITLVFPLQIGPLNNVNSRIPSLVSLDDSNGASLWEDLIERVAALEEPRHLVTDSVTNYVLTSSTHHSGKYDGKKGWGDKESWQQRKTFFDENFKTRLFDSKFDGSLLIVNHRDGKASRTGQISGHWWVDILRVSEQYPSNLSDVLREHPERFSLIWSSDRIWVYEILGVTPEHISSVPNSWKANYSLDHS